MVTILVVYTNNKVDNKAAKKIKYNAFKADNSIIEIGDMLKSNEYDTAMQVVDIINENYAYYNMTTGELSNKFNSTAQREIRTLIIRSDETDVVYAVKINKD